jgi:hypothetical protein
MAHARRKFYDLHANHKSQLAEQTLGDSAVGEWLPHRWKPMLAR